MLLWLCGACLAVSVSAHAAAIDDGFQRLERYLDRFGTSPWAADEAAASELGELFRLRLLAALSESPSPPDLPVRNKKLFRAYDDVMTARLLAAESKSPEPGGSEVPTELTIAAERARVADALKTDRRTSLHFEYWQRCQRHGRLDLLARGIERYLEGRSDKDLVDIRRGLQGQPGFTELLRSIFTGPAAVDSTIREDVARALVPLGDLTDLRMPPEIDQAVRLARARELLEVLDDRPPRSAPAERIAEFTSELWQQLARLEGNRDRAAELDEKLQEAGLRSIRLSLKSWTSAAALPGGTVTDARIVSIDIWHDQRPVPIATPPAGSSIQDEWWLPEGRSYRLHVRAELVRGNEQEEVLHPLLVSIESGTGGSREISFPRFLANGTRPIANAVAPSQTGVLVTAPITEADWLRGFASMLERSALGELQKEACAELLEVLVERGSQPVRDELAQVSVDDMAKLRERMARAAEVASDDIWTLTDDRGLSLVRDILTDSPAGELPASSLTVLQRTVSVHRDILYYGDPYGLLKDGSLWLALDDARPTPDRPLTFRLVVK
ncbi:MAG: hypothetical protein RL885_13130 [Planctomycetota bacterium]